MYKTFAICCLLAIAVFMIYGQTVRHEFINCDDDPYVFGNPYVARGITKEGVAWAMTTTHAGNWHPLTWISHMLDVECYGIHDLDHGRGTGNERWRGPEAGGHHLTNVWLHVASAIILFLALRQMTGAIWLSALTAAMFAVHPLRVESVAWIAERKDVLSGLFWMLTLLAYGWYVRRPKVGRYLLVAACFALGLTAKSMLVTLPFVLLLLDIWPLGRVKLPPLIGGGSEREISDFWQQVRDVMTEKIPLFFISLAVCVIIVVGQHSAGAMSMSKDVSLDIRVANAMSSYVVYLWQMIWPVNLAIFYPHPGVLKDVSMSRIMWSAVLATMLLAAITLVVLSQIRRRPFFAVGWFWYLGTLVPVIGFVRVGVQAYADRYTYLPMIGIYMAIVWGVAELAKRNRRLVVPLSVAACLLLGTWTAMAINQTSTWRTSVTVFEHAIAVVPDNFFAYNHLGLAYHNVGSIYHNAGDSERARENFDRAGENYAKSVEIAPDYDSANGNLGVYYAYCGKLDMAIKYFKHASETNPFLSSFHANLGMAYLRKGDAAKAEPELREALEIDPHNLINRISLRNALLQQGKMREAVKEQRKLVSFCPNDSILLNETAMMLATYPDKAIRNGKEALTLAKRAVYLTEGSNPAMLDTLAAAYAEVGQFPDAIQTARRAANLALSQKKQPLANSLRAKLKLYKAGIPFRTSAPAPNR